MGTARSDQGRAVSNPRILSGVAGWYWVRIGPRAHLVPPRSRADMRTLCGKPAIDGAHRIRPAGNAPRCEVCSLRDRRVYE
jgi:hypothetical protein